MSDITTKTNWQKIIDAANQSDIEDGEAPTRPATDEDIASLRRRAAQRGLGVNEDFVTFLRYANGISYNCLTIPGAEIDPGYHDFVIYNDRKSYIEIGPVYGNLNDTYYVLYPDGIFRRMSASEDVISTYASFFEMLTEALAMAVGPTLPDDNNLIVEIYAESLRTTA